MKIKVRVTYARKDGAFTSYSNVLIDSIPLLVDDFNDFDNPSISLTSSSSVVTLRNVPQQDVKSFIWSELAMEKYIEAIPNLGEIKSIEIIE